MKRVLALLLAAACLGLPALAAGRVTTTASVNLRSRPGLDGDVIAAYVAGTSLEYLGEASVDGRGVTWYRVTAPAGEGWVSSRYAELAFDAEAAVELSEYYRADLRETAAVLSLTDYTQVVSEAPNCYSGEGLSLYGDVDVACMDITGPGYTLLGMSVGMPLDDARRAALDAGLELYSDNVDGFSVEYPGTNPLFLAADDCGGIIYVTEEDGAVKEIDLEAYTG